jgi:hypothetical protein
MPIRTIGGGYDKMKRHKTMKAKTNRKLKKVKPSIKVRDLVPGFNPKGGAVTIQSAPSAPSIPIAKPDILAGGLL